MSRDIVLVGNGPSVLASSAGPTIDLFTDVVRFNGYRLAGFEQSVGARTTIWARWHGVGPTTSLENLRQIWLVMPPQERSASKIDAGLAIAESFSGTVRLIPDIEIAKRLQNDLFGAHHDTLWPSTGLLTIAHCVHASYDVTICGFDSWSHEPYHYYEQHDRSRTHHVAHLERAYIKSLLSGGHIKLLETGGK
jgi:hypothetical protein